MSVTYEVNLSVEKSIQKDFEKWLVGHIDDVLAIDGFESAQWFQVATDSSTHVEWKVDYILRDQQSLDSYLEKHAPRLRQPAKDQFGAKFNAHRRVLTPVKSYRKP